MKTPVQKSSNSNKVQKSSNSNKTASATGELERRVKKRARRENIQKFVLAAVGTVGLLAFAAAAPNAVQALAKLGIIDLKRGYRYISRINRARDHLIDVGLLSKNTDGFLRLTSEGERELRRLELHDFKLKKPRRWDKKWRMLIFDIPEYRKPLRDRVRRTLMAIGFVRLQDSVWVYPYPCDDLIALLKADFKIGKELLYLVVEEMEGEKTLLQEFGLSRN